MISKFTCGMMHNYRIEPPHCQRISKDSGALFLTDFSLLRLKILHRRKKAPAKWWNCFFKNIYYNGKSQNMLPVAARLFVTLDKTFWRCICWLQIKLQPLSTASTSNAENVQNNKNLNGWTVAISSYTDIDGLLQIASQPAKAN